MLQRLHICGMVLVLAFSIGVASAAEAATPGKPCDQSMRNLPTST